MRTITSPLKLIAILIPLFMLFGISKTYSQTIIIDSTFSSDAEIFPFSSVDTIFGLSVSGSVELLSDTSLVRIILTDNSGNKWMVYEAYPMIVTDTAFDISAECDETCFLNECMPNSVIVQIINSNLLLNSLSYSEEVSGNMETLQYQFKKTSDSLKV